MRLLCFIDSLGSGGAQRQMLAVAKHMKQKGQEVYIAWYADDDFYRAAFEEIEVGCIHRTTSGMRDRFRFFSEAVKQANPDTVLSFVFAQTIISSFYKLMSFGKWNLVISMRSNNEETFLSRQRRTLRPLYLSAKAIVCNSFSESEVWKKNCRYLSNKVMVIPNYIKVPTDSNERKQREVHYPLRILVAANLCSTIKNPLNVAKAIEMLSDKERSRIKVDWYGRRTIGKRISPVCEEVEAFIKQHNLVHTFATHDEVHDIYSKMADSDCVALFSTEEGLPNTICEGMMIGKPVMMTKVSDWKKLIDGNGIVCEGTDAESIATAVRKLISLSDQDMTAMGKASLALASMLFDENIITKKWESALW